jgi:hypothetical protein
MTTKVIATTTGGTPKNAIPEIDRDTIRHEHTKPKESTEERREKEEDPLSGPTYNPPARKQASNQVQSHQSSGYEKVHPAYNYAARRLLRSRCHTLMPIQQVE